MSFSWAPAHAPRTYRSRWPLVALAAAIVLFASPAARACSTCKCGDPTITLLGSEKAFSGRTRIGLDYLWRDETAGSDISRTRVDEQRLTLGVAISPTPDWTFALQAPLVEKTLQLPSLENQQSRGWGDVDLNARYTVWRSGPMSGSHLAGLRLGARLPSAETLRDVNGTPLSIDVQPDAGALALQAGGWYAFHRFPWFASASAVYSQFGDGNQDFDPGNAVNLGAFVQYALNFRAALIAGIDARHAQSNRENNTTVLNTGGNLLMARLGTAWRIGNELVISLAWQTTAIDNLNGEQTEGDYFRAAFAYDF